MHDETVFNKPGFWWACEATCTAKALFFRFQKWLKSFTPKRKRWGILGISLNFLHVPRRKRGIVRFRGNSIVFGLVRQGALRNRINKEKSLPKQVTTCPFGAFSRAFPVVKSLHCNMSHEKKGPWLVGLYRGLCYTQLYRDYNRPLQGSLLNNQYNGK